MAEINAKDVMRLRNKTDLAMMACKKALIEAGGDVEKAEDLLRKELKGKMDTKMDRAAGEGRIEVAVADSGCCATIVELRAETDFTAKNDKFIDDTKKIVEAAFSIEASELITAPRIAARMKPRSPLPPPWERTPRIYSRRRKTGRSGPC